MRWLCDVWREDMLIQITSGSDKLGAITAFE